MTATTTRSADGLVYAVCPKPECGATLRITPKSARTNVTCASCGHRFKLEVLDSRRPSASAPSPDQSFTFGADSPSTKGPAKSRRKSSPVGPLVAVGVAVLLLAGGIVGVLNASRDKQPTNQPATDVANNNGKGVSEKDKLLASGTTPTKPKEVKPDTKQKKEEPDTKREKEDPRPKLKKVEPDPIIVKPPIIPPTRDDIVARVKKSTAQIKSTFGWGTGFVYAPNIIVTNAHVLAGRPISDFRVIFVSLDDTDPPKLPAELLYYDARRDLAILRVKTDRPPLEKTAPGTELGNMQVAVVGNPRDAAGQAEINKVTFGKLSNVPIGRDEGTFYELSAEAFFGNSGGPVVDEKTGKLVGVMQSILGDGKKKTYCIPFGEVQRALEMIPAVPEKEALAIKIAAGRHALDSIATKMPETEENASAAMDGQCTLLKAKSEGWDGYYILENGTRLTKEAFLLLLETLMDLFKDTHAETFKTFDEAQKAIDRSPEIPEALRGAVRQRVHACGQMRFLAGAKTKTEKSFRDHMKIYRAESLAAVKKFNEVYKTQLDSIATKAAARK